MTQIEAGNRILRAVLVTTAVVCAQACGMAIEIKPAVLNKLGNSQLGGGGGSGSGIPVAPTQLTVLAVSAAQVNLFWVDNSNSEAGFKIERASAVSGPFVNAPGTFVTIATTNPNAISYQDTTVSGSTSYFYRVSAVNGAGSSPTTIQQTVTTPSAPVTPPLAPSGLLATATAPTIVQLSWADNSSNEFGFRVERSSDNGGTFSLVATVFTNGITFQDYNLNPQTTYVYRVRASNSAGDSAFTANAAATTPAAGNMASYSYISVNITGPNCLDCHGGNLTAAGVSYANYNATRGTVSANNPNGSALYTSIVNGRMPPGVQLSAQQSGAIRAWIEAGAPNN